MEMKDDSGVSIHTKHDEAETSVITSSNPVVFQCSQCDAIVGDSTSWVSANKIMRTVTLGRVTSKVGVKSEIQISQSGVDKGSTYCPVYCISCNEVLGKQYMASPPELDYIRGSFTIHVEKLNSYEVGSAQTTGSSELADMLNIPSPGYLMARVNKMQFLIVSMNDRIKKLEACLTDQKSTGKTANMEHSDKKMRSCTLGETESVSSSDNFSTIPRASSPGSGYTDVFDTGYGQNLRAYRQDVLTARPLNVEKFGDLGRNLEQHTRAVDRNIESLNKDRVIKRGVRSNDGSSRSLNQRSPRNEHIDSVLNDERENETYADTDYEETENLGQIQQRQIGRRGRKEHLEMNQQRVENARSGEQTNTILHDVNRLATGSKNSNLKNRGINQETVNIGFTSPNVRGSVSRTQSKMETWPSPGIERKDDKKKERDSKKRRIFEINDSR